MKLIRKRPSQQHAGYSTIIKFERILFKNLLKCACARPRAAKKDEGARAAKPKTTVKRTRKPASKEGDAGANDEGKKE